MKNKLFINCKEAAHRIDKAQYGEASFIEKLSIALHNLYCRLCRFYTSKNKKLTRLFKTGNARCLTSEQKEKMKEKIQGKQ